MAETPERRVREIAVSEIMSRSVLAVDSSVAASEAAKMMEDARVSALVVTENSSPAGIITERDFAVKVAAHAYPLDTPVRRIMSSPLVVVGRDESVWAAADLMVDRGVHKLPVVDSDQIVGIVTKTDLVRQISTCEEGQVRRKYIESVGSICRQNTPYL